MPRVLILEDHDPSRNHLEQHFRSEGFEVVAFARGAEALTFLQGAADGRRPPPDVAVLDRTLGDMDGLEVMRRIRATPQLHDMQVLMVTARGDELDRVLGLELGADDYLVKPFSTRELMARIRAIGRRGAPKAMSEASCLRRRDLLVDLEAFTVTRAGQEVPLTRREFELLVYFLRHPAQALTRSHLMREVWKLPASEENRTVDVHVRRLRSKLGDALDGLETIVGVGYRLD